jgi:hypothetical protein
MAWQGEARQGRRGKAWHGRAGHGPAGMENQQEKKTMNHEIKEEIVIAELKRIASEHNGVLRAKDVVEEAKPKTSPLHDRFTWDDSEAAHLWRLEEARHMIRVTVEYIDDGKNRLPMRVFVSLSPDRQETGGGYRPTVTVMSNAEMRKQLLADACEEMDGFKDKFKSLNELADVFKAMGSAKRRIGV